MRKEKSTAFTFRTQDLASTIERELDLFPLIVAKDPLVSAHFSFTKGVVRALIIKYMSGNQMKS